MNSIDLPLNSSDFVLLGSLLNLPYVSESVVFGAVDVDTQFPFTINITTVEDIEEFFKTQGNVPYHGNNGMTKFADPESGKVHGIENVFVADASILPFFPSSLGSGIMIKAYDIVSKL